jgi:hypothetical protein
MPRRNRLNRRLEIRRFVDVVNIINCIVEDGWRQSSERKANATYDPASECAANAPREKPNKKIRSPA